MKLYLLLFIAFILSLNCQAQTGKETMEKPKETMEKPVYDSLLARKLGADEYGMKKYVMAFLKSGEKEIQDSTERANLQIAHLKNIQRLAEDGKLIVAGPFLDNQKLRGIFIFNVESIEEARELTKTDPAIKAGTLDMELRPWYGPAALIEVIRVNKTLEKRNVAE